MTSEPTTSPDVAVIAKETIFGLIVIATLTVTLCAAVVWRARSTANDTPFDHAGFDHAGFDHAGFDHAGDAMVATAPADDLRRQGPRALAASPRALGPAASGGETDTDTATEPPPVLVAAAHGDDVADAVRPIVVATASVPMDASHTAPRPANVPRPFEVPPQVDAEIISTAASSQPTTAKTKPTQLVAPPSPGGHNGGSRIQPTFVGQASSVDPSAGLPQTNGIMRPTEPPAGIAPPSPTAIQQSASDPVYIVLANDSYWTISLSVYGTGDYFKALIAHNAKFHNGPRQLTVGDKVLTPPRQFLLRHYSALCPVDTVP